MKRHFPLAVLGIILLAGCSPNAPASGTESAVGGGASSAGPSPTSTPATAQPSKTVAITQAKSPRSTTFWPTSDPGSPILVNGDFEQGTGQHPNSWTPDVWASGRTTFGWETGQPGCHSRCASITNNQENDARWIQTIWVTPGKKYILSGRIKGVNIQGNPVGANLFASMDEFNHTETAGSTGTFDWKTVAMTFVGPDNGHLVVGCRLGFYGSTVTGTAYFDDISVVEEGGAAPAASPTPGPAIGSLKAQPSTDADLDTIPSIWTLTEFKVLTGPGGNTYSVDVDYGSAWLWDCYFCTTEEAFEDFFETLTLEFRINNIPLAEEFIRIYDRPGNTGWLCRNWSTKLTNWPRNETVYLKIFYRHSRTASDGRDEFAAGDYGQTIVVTVKG